MLKDFISLIYPEVCFGCDETLKKGEDKICISCYVNLPSTNYHIEKIVNNTVMKRFYGKVTIKEAFSYLQFVKGGLVQKLMYNLKYNGKQDIGILLGERYGRMLKEANLCDCDIIIPVPMYIKKKKKRGYNQADCIAEGFSKSMNICWNNKVIEKVIDTESQTKKSRFKRWLNTEEVFTFLNGENIEEKRILLVDDVITTGATLEACAKLLLEKGMCKSVSVATIAIAL